MKNIFVCLLFMIPLIIAVSFQMLSAEIIPITPEGLLSAAKIIMSERFGSDPQSYIESMPCFRPGDSLEDFRLGEPFPFYKLNQKAVYNLKDNNDFGNALTFRAWQMPLYLGDEDEPRALVIMKKTDDEKWRYAAMGGNPKDIHKARQLWPAEEGYRHATIVFSSTNIHLIMLEKDNKLQFCYYGDGGERAFGLSRNEDGSWPVFTKDHLIRIVRSGKIDIGKKTGPD